MIGRGRRFADRRAAGCVLADALGRELADHDQTAGPPLVLALPRGGVPVAVPVADRFGVAVSVLVVRKLGAPGQPELAVGAIAALGETVERVINPGWLSALGLTEQRLDQITARETTVLRDRVATYGSAPPVAGRTVIVVDDGLATGATMQAGVAAVRSAGAAYVVAAAPVGAVGACRDLAGTADLVVCPVRPDPFRAVGEHYDDFGQLSDADVLTLLGR